MLRLSDKKQKIVEQNGHLLVIGGPGSGKTTVSIVKADKLVTDTLRRSQKVLFLSFARATVARVSEALDQHSTIGALTRKQVDIDTYHAFFWRLIKTHGYLVGLPRRLQVLTPPAVAVALAPVRDKFGPVRKQTDAQKEERKMQEAAELQRLAFEEGRVSFDLFSKFVAEILEGSAKIRALLSSAFPIIILDEFQDTSDGQWRVVQQLGIGSELIALADEEQRIYEFIGANPERLNHFRKKFSPTEFDVGDESHRSPGTDIGRFGNDIVKGVFTGPYIGIKIFRYPAIQNQAIKALKVQAIKARKRLIDRGEPGWSLAVLVPTKRMMRQLSIAFREESPVINHRSAIDMEGVVLAAEIIAFLMQPSGKTDHYAQFVDLVCKFFLGRGGEDVSTGDIGEAARILKAYKKAKEVETKGGSAPANSIINALRAGYLQCRGITMTGDPEQDWVAIRAALFKCGCSRLVQVAKEALNVRLLERGAQLRDALALDWRDNGGFENALEIVRQAFVQEHFAAPTRKEVGVFIMNMHKAKGKQFDEVVVFEGWPRIFKGKIVANVDRFCRDNTLAGDHVQSAKYNFRVSVTRARSRTTIMTPDSDPSALLNGFSGA